MIDPQLSAAGEALIVTGMFDQDHRYRHRRSRGTRDWLLFATEAGAGFCATGQHRVRLEPRSLACYVPGTPQDYGTETAPGHWRFHWAHVDPRPEWPALLAWPSVCPGLRYLVIDDEALFAAIRSSFAVCHHDALGPLSQHQELARNALERVLLLADCANPATSGPRLDPRVRRALEHIGSHLDRALSLVDLAAHCDSSASRLAHLFREQVGVPPMRFHEQQRLQRAARLLVSSALPVHAIAAQVGFGDPFYFSNRFRRHHGCSPRAWRRRCAD